MQATARALPLPGHTPVLPGTGLGGHPRGEGRVGEQGIGAQVERARAGDRQAFGELFRIYQGDVTRLCRRLLGSAAEADDARGEVFLRAGQHLEEFDARRTFRTWLLAIAAHHCIDRLRRRGLESRLFEVGDGTADVVDLRAPTALDGLLQAERRARLLAAVDALPDRYRLPLVLRYFADLDYQTIADQHGVGRGQVGSLLFRGRQQLRSRLRDEAADR